jgi:hypothetical protein
MAHRYDLLVLVSLMTLLLLVGISAMAPLVNAQYLYLDANGDGLSSEAGRWAKAHSPNSNIVDPSVAHVLTGVGDVFSPPLNEFGMVRRIYPVPARGPVNVDAFGPNSTSATIRIVQPTGRVVREFAFHGLIPGQYQLLGIDVSGLPAGVYFLVYRDPAIENGIKAGRKIVIVR